MIPVVRMTGFLLIIAGILVLLTWFIEPLRELLPQFWEWFKELPLPIRVGLTLAGTGLTLLFASLLVERWQDRDADKSLQEDKP